MDTRTEKEIRDLLIRVRVLLDEDTYDIPSPHSNRHRACIEEIDRLLDKTKPTETVMPSAFVIQEAIIDLVRKHHLAIESLTEAQLAEVIKQAIASGDFVINVRVDSLAQAVTYIPFREVDHWKLLYNELVMAVAQKHPEETRHETALRYIQERERVDSTAGEAKSEP